MSETSRSRVTITLGRTGQVVKRDGSAINSSHTDSHLVVGSKRSVRERLGNNVDSSVQFRNKRLRGDGRATISVDEDIQLSKDDLRYKIMQKNVIKQSQNSHQNGVDLRNILSRPAQSSTNSIPSREKIPVPKDERLHYLEPKDGRQHITEARDGRQSMSVTRSSSQHLPEYRVQRLPDPRVQYLPEARDGGRIILEPRDVRHRMPEMSRSSMMSDVPGLRATNAVAKMESGINSCSPWTLDRLRRRSPDEALAMSRGLSAPMRDEELQRRFAVRTFDDTRTSTYMSKDAFEFSRPTSSSSYLANMAPPGGPMKTMAPVVSTRPLPGSLAQKSSYVVDDHPTVDSFLRSLGLEKFAILFKAEEVDMYSLKRMADSELKELGIPMGPRKKILLALQPRLKQLHDRYY